MTRPTHRQRNRPAGSRSHHDDSNAAVLRPTEGAAGAPPSDAQRRYLERGLTEPGGKLPLFDREGREVPRKTIEVCIDRGWAQRWTVNPIEPGWLVCRLTPAGYRVLGQEPRASV